MQEGSAAGQRAARSCSPQPLLAPAQGERLSPPQVEPPPAPERALGVERHASPLLRNKTEGLGQRVRSGDLPHVTGGADPSQERSFIPSEWSGQWSYSHSKRSEEWKAKSEEDASGCGIRRVRRCLHGSCCSGLCGCLYMVLPVGIVALLLALAAVLGIAISAHVAVRQPSSVTISGGSIYVNGAPFVVKGVAYSPVWKGLDAASKWPYGDHMFQPRVSEGQFAWTFHSLAQGASDFDRFDEFHLSKIKAAGFNTIRLYNWLLDKDHTAFLDNCHKFGLMVIVTFWMDTGLYGPLNDIDQRHKAKVNFEHLLRRYKDHPAVLMWALGNEPNMPGTPKSYHSQMPEFFSLCDELREVRDREEGGAATRHPIIIPMAATPDLNAILKIFDMSPGFDMWGIQPYMSVSDLNRYLLNLQVDSKPILVTEYGMDSLYDDRGRQLGGLEPLMESAADEHGQVELHVNLTKIMFKFLAGKTRFPVCMPDGADCDNNRTVSVHALPWPETVFDAEPVNEGHINTETGYQENKYRDNGNPRQHLDKVIDDWGNDRSVLQNGRYNRLAGMVVFEWMDEWWKGHKDDPDHPDCDQNDGDRQSSCGYLNDGFGRDWRVNEEFFGMAAQDRTRVSKDNVCLRPKPLFYASQVIFGNSADLSRAAPFCPECAGPAGRNDPAVDASYLTRLRVAAAPQADRLDAAIAYGTQQVAKDTANATRWSKGDINDADRYNPTGVVTITDRAPKPMRIDWWLAGVPGRCELRPGKNNSCGIRIHEGKTCHSAAFGEHLFRRGPDPWAGVDYAAGRMRGSALLDIGYRLTSIIGRAIVMYDAEGDPAACGILDSHTGWAPARSGVLVLRPLRSASEAIITGAVNVTDAAAKPIRSITTLGGAYHNLTLRVLSGADCFSPGQPLSFDRDDPWSADVMTAVDNTTTTIAYTFDNGYALADLFGRVLAVHNGTEVVACAVIRRRAQLEGFAVFGNYRPGGLLLTGAAELYDETQRELHISWNMRSLTRNCTESASADKVLACTISLRTVVGEQADGSPIAVWWNSGDVYHSDALGTSTGNIPVTTYRKALADMGGMTVDFRDELGRVNTRGELALETDTVVVRYDGYRDQAECPCCVQSPLRSLVDFPIEYCLLGVGVLLCLSASVLVRFLVYKGSHKQDDERKQGSGTEEGGAADPDAVGTQQGGRQQDDGRRGRPQVAQYTIRRRDVCNYFQRVLSVSVPPTERGGAAGPAAVPWAGPAAAAAAGPHAAGGKDQPAARGEEGGGRGAGATVPLLDVLQLGFCNPLKWADWVDAESQPGAPDSVGDSPPPPSPQYNYNLAPAYEALVSTVHNVALRYPKFPPAEGKERLLSYACRRVYEETVPTECRLSCTRRPPLVKDRMAADAEDGQAPYECFGGPAARALLYLAVQQRVDGLRQCRWFKAAAYNHILRQSDAGRGLPGIWAAREAMHEVAAVARHHLAQVQEEWVNYADIDDVYQSIVFRAHASKLCACLPPLIFNRRCRSAKQYKDFADVAAHVKNVTENQAVKDGNEAQKKVVKDGIVDRTFPELLSWFVPMRLFSFTFHGHVVLFYIAVAVNLRLPFSTTMWMLGEVEAIFCFLNFAIDLWMFPFPKFGFCPSLLTMVDLAVSVIYVMKAGPGLDPLVWYICWMLVSQAAIRPLWTLHRIRQGGDAGRVLVFRWLTLLAMFVAQVFVALFYIAPGIATIGTSLCRCPVEIIDWLVALEWLQASPNTCTTDIRDYLCFLGVFAFYICTFLCLTLMAHVSYMLLSIIGGYVVAFRKKLGVAKTWSHVQDVARTGLGSTEGPDLALYGKFMPDPPATAEVAVSRGSADRQKWMYASVFNHMWERDLISAAQLKAYTEGNFSQPPPEEGLVQILQFLNGHVGLKALFPEKEMKEDSKNEMTPELEKDDYFQCLQECVSVRCMRSLSVMVPYYKEIVLFPTGELRGGLLRHLVGLWPAEWRFFCARNFFGYGNAEGILEEFESGRVVDTWIARRDQYEDDCFKCAKNPGQNKKWGAHWWRLDPPPPSPLNDPDLAEVMLRLQRANPEIAEAGAGEDAAGESGGAAGLEARGNFPVMMSARTGYAGDPRAHPDFNRPRQLAFPHSAARQLSDVHAVVGRPPLHPVGHRSGQVAAGDAAPARAGEPLSREFRKLIKEQARFDDDVRKLLGKHRRSVQYWVERQVRLWASLRGQTLARLAYGLHEMRAAVCDLAYFELTPEGSGAPDPVPLTTRSTVFDVCAWVHQGDYKRWYLPQWAERALVEARKKATEHAELTKEVEKQCRDKVQQRMRNLSSRVADVLVFACRYWRLGGAQLHQAVLGEPASPAYPARMPSAGAALRTGRAQGTAAGAEDSALSVVWDLQRYLADQGFRDKLAAWCSSWFPLKAEDRVPCEHPAADAKAAAPLPKQGDAAVAREWIEAVCGALADSLVSDAVRDAFEQTERRQEADELVSHKLQFCLGGQAYWQDADVRRGTDELLRMDRLRYLEVVTDREVEKVGAPDGGKARKAVVSWWRKEREEGRFAALAAFNTVHIRRQDAGRSYCNFLHRFGPPEWYVPGKNDASFKNDDDLSYMREAEAAEFDFTIFHRQSRLRLGEPKAENQNNAITCARGELLQMLDMNQDAYYAEGIKLPLVLQLWDNKFAGTTESGRKHIRAKSMGHPPEPGQEPKDFYHLLGFREHIFTESHSAVGRYMALAEFSFVTLIQRFLANPHEVRLHYGHPDMVKAAHMKQTGGVSRSSVRVNLSEDIFLGYEMAATGKNVAMIEYISYGKGREVEFNNASVFLKKLAAGSVTQLAARQVYTLYTQNLWTPQKWALFYGSLAHFINIYLMDFTVFLFTYTLMIFALADLTPQNFRLLESPLAEPWLFQVGMAYILPMLVERNLERSYLHLSDFVMSIPFFTHQNRITAAMVGMTMHTCQGKYGGTGRGMGHGRNSVIHAYVEYTGTNFIPGLRLLLCAAVYYWAGYACADCRTSDSDLFRLWIVLVSAFSYLMAPSLYNPRPTFTAAWQEWADTMAWINEPSHPRWPFPPDKKQRGAVAKPEKPGECLQFGDRDECNSKRCAEGRWEKLQGDTKGQARSMRTLWVCGWLDYLNSIGLNAAAADGLERVPQSIGVFLREVVMIVSKYGLWAIVPLVGFTMSRGDDIAETAPDGTVTTKEAPRMMTFNWGLFAFIILDICTFIMKECFLSISRKLPPSSKAEKYPRIIRLAIVPVLYIVLLVSIWLATDQPLEEALAELFFYLVFAGIGFAALTELVLAVAQLIINLQGSRDRGRCWRRHRRLDILFWMGRWNPLILFYERMYILIGICVVGPNALLAAIARVHTTWLFTEQVARTEPGKK